MAQIHRQVAVVVARKQSEVEEPGALEGAAEATRKQAGMAVQVQEATA